MATIKGGDVLRARLRGIAAKASKSPSVSIGFLPGATYPDGTSVPMVAAANEYGDPASGRPPRPFFRRMIAEHKGEWPNTAAKQLKATDYDMHKTLDRMGQGIVGQLQQSIRTFTDPPLAASTIKAKGFATPLRDTNDMLNSVKHEVDD